MTKLSTECTQWDAMFAFYSEWYIASLAGHMGDPQGFTLCRGYYLCVYHIGRYIVTKSQHTVYIHVCMLWNISP